MSDAAIEAGKNFVDHTGVKGMHWGIRKKRPTRTVTIKDRFTGTTGEIIIPNSTRSKRENKKVKKLTKTVHPPAHQLSEEQLKAAVNRMQLERQYNSLIGTKKAASTVTSDFLKGVGSTAVKTALTALVTQQISEGLKKGIKIKKRH